MGRRVSRSSTRCQRPSRATCSQMVFVPDVYFFGRPNQRRSAGANSIAPRGSGARSRMAIRRGEMAMTNGCQRVRAPLMVATRKRPHSL